VCRSDPRGEHRGWEVRSRSRVSICARLSPLVSGTRFQKYATATKVSRAKRKNVPALEMVLSSVRNEMATTKFVAQLAMAATLIDRPRILTG